MNPILNYAIIIFVVMVIAVGQLIFKTVSLRLGDRGFEVLLTDHRTALLFVAALAAYGISTLGWVLALRNVPLNTAYLFMSASFIIVPVMAYFVLDEPITARLALGSALIVCGVLVAATSNA
ncbi:MAG TPA: EamA family transporter [Rhizobiaceae bacterium]|nr:EamA family transporter [Rhizobiaceae bacterium]